MATEVKLPQLGENIESASVTRILVSPGEEIQVDQPVLEIETDKATAEVPSSAAGKVTEIRVKEGQKVRVGEIVLILADGASAPAGATKSAPAPAPAAKQSSSRPPARSQAPKPAPREEAAPELDEEGDDAAERALEAPTTTGLQLNRTGSEDGDRRTEPARPAAPTEVPQTEAVRSIPDNMERAGGEPAAAAPSVRRLAREIGVDVNAVPGSGPGGRISIEDVKQYARQMNVDAGGVVHRAHTGPHVPTEPLPDFARWGEVDRQEMASIRRRTAEHMAHAWATIPHVTQFDKADVSEVERMRKQFGKRVEAAGGKLTVTAILVKVIAHALQKFPQFNTSIDVANGQIIQKKYYNVGIAVDTDRGLLVPVIRDADKKNILDIAVEMNVLAERARNRKATLEDMQGGTFTITNLGGIGGTGFTPIVNSPEVAILGVARTQVEPVYVDGQFQPRSMLPLALSYDHRVIDGADGARFLRWVAEAIEQPFLLFMEG